MRLDHLLSKEHLASGVLVLCGWGGGVQGWPAAAVRAVGVAHGWNIDMRAVVLGSGPLVPPGDWWGTRVLGVGGAVRGTLLGPEGTGLVFQRVCCLGGLAFHQTARSPCCRGCG